MYITRITLKNIRCFSYLDLDLSRPEGIKRWCLLLGDNGTGKTTVLRSIALGLCYEADAAGLLSELFGDWVRHDSSDPLASVRILLRDLNGRTYRVTTKMKALPFKNTQVKQSTSPGFPWGDLFVCGYGAARRLINTASFDHYFTVDSVYSLFNSDANLHNPEVALRRLPDTGADPATILDTIADILLLPTGSIQLGARGLTVNGPWGACVPLGATGDGYQATLAWISDLLGWALLNRAGDSPKHWSAKDIVGIVLLDEIEQHLHPRWQQRIISRLSNQFPGIQFISTTHSPLCTIGVTDLRNEDCSIVLLQQDGDAVIGLNSLAYPRPGGADELLTSHLFGLSTVGTDKIREDIATYQTLSEKRRRTRDDESELRAIRARLSERFDAAETPLEREIRDAVYKILVEGGTSLVRPAVDLEVKRQLRHLLRDQRVDD